MLCVMAKIKKKSFPCCNAINKATQHIMQRRTTQNIYQHTLFDILQTTYIYTIDLRHIGMYKEEQYTVDIHIKPLSHFHRFCF